jgi:hypothetical protein
MRSQSLPPINTSSDIEEEFSEDDASEENAQSRRTGTPRPGDRRASTLHLMPDPNVTRPQQPASSVPGDVKQIQTFSFQVPLPPGKCDIRVRLEVEIKTANTSTTKFLWDRLEISDRPTGQAQRIQPTTTSVADANNASFSWQSANSLGSVSSGESQPDPVSPILGRH